MVALRGYSYEADQIVGIWTDDDRIAALPAMTHVADNLWLGGQPVYGLPEGCVAVVNCDEVRYYDEPPDALYVHTPFVDGEELPDLDRLLAVARLVNELRKVGPVLVHCRLGLNRSALQVAVCLVELGADPDWTISHLRAARDARVLANPVFDAYLRSLGRGVSRAA